MFRLMGTIIIDGAQQLKDMLDDYSDPLTSQRAIKDTEHKGDSQTHEIIRRLNKTFITPFDREDIYALAGALDDILDLIDASAQRLVMYNVDQPTDDARKLAEIILNSCHAVGRACSIWAARMPISAPAASRSTCLKTKPIRSAAAPSAISLTRRRTQSS